MKVRVLGRFSVNIFEAPPKVSASSPKPVTPSGSWVSRQQLTATLVVELMMALQAFLESKTVFSASTVMLLNVASYEKGLPCMTFTLEGMCSFWRLVRFPKAFFPISSTAPRLRLVR